MIAHRFGILSEYAFMGRDEVRCWGAVGAGKVERWIYKDKEGFLYGYPSVVEVDVVVRDNTHVLIEIKSRVTKWDIVHMKRVKDLYERVNNVKASALIVGGFIDPGAWEAAGKLGIDIKPAFKED